MDEEFIKRHARVYFDGDRFAALRSALSIRLRARDEDVTEAAIAAEALRLDARALAVHGMLYPNVKAVAKARAVSDSAVWARMRDRGQTVEQAIDTLRGQRPRFRGAVVVCNKSYPSIQAAALAHGVDTDTLSARLRKGQDISEAIDALVRRAERRVDVVAYGVLYPSIRAAAMAHGVSYGALSGRLHNDEAIERAIETLPQARRSRHRLWARIFERQCGGKGAWRRQPSRLLAHARERRNR